MRFVKEILLVFVLLVSVNVFADDDKLTGTTIYSGSVSTSQDYAYDGNVNTYFATNETEWTWVGLDLGSAHVITKIGYCPRNESPKGPDRMVLGVFEGANQKDFMDAVPLYLISTQPETGEVTYVDCKVSRGFRYVRYVSPKDGKCNIAELEFYGHEGEGDDTQFYQVTGLPTISLHVESNINPETKGEDYESNMFIAYENGTLFQEYPILTRVRGNYSASWDNKPYRIKFNDDKKHHMLHGSEKDESPAKAKKWCLISSYGDKTLMRNPVAYEVSKRVGLPFTPWCKPVDLILNGEYRGTYQLVDHVEVGDDRIDITKMTTEDIEGEALTGGYMFEMNGYAYKDPVNFTSNKGNPITVHNPEDDEIQDVQFNYLKDYFNGMESAVFADNYTDPEEGYREKLDLTTFLQYFLSNEFSSNTDYAWQIFMYKERGDSHIYTGPVWDNDLALENDVNYYPGNMQGRWVYTVRSAGSWDQLISRVLSDGNAMAQLKEMWKKLRKNEVFTAENIAGYVDSLRNEMAASADLNFKRWPYLNQQVHCNPKVYGTWDAEVDNVRDYVYDRVGWMDSMLSLAPKKENDVYQLGSALDVAEFAAIVNEGETTAKAVLTADIDFSECEETMSPIGDLSHVFTGTFDGQRHTIKNLVITGDDYVGLFGVIGAGADISNIMFDPSCSFEGNSYVGAVAGFANGAATVSCIANNATLNGKAYCSAFIGSGTSATITSSYFNGSLSGETAHIMMSNKKTAVSDQQLRSGEACYLLNAGTSTNWRQNIDNGRTVDALPTLLHNHGAVYLVDGNYTNINPNQAGYQYYMLRITSIGDGNVLQMSEFDLLDDEEQEISDLTAYACNVDGFGSETWTNLTDNQTGTKYCSRFDGDTYVMFMTGDVVHPYGYRIYTANDTQSYPGRNPRSWTLWAAVDYTDDPSDDNWELIDEIHDDSVLQATNYLPYDFYIEWPKQPTDITPVTNAAQQTIYGSDGSQQSRLHKGLNIIRQSDGTVRKVLVK